MKYIILMQKPPYLHLFEKEIREYIELGWTPQGGVAVAVVNDREQIYQAMIKHTPT